MKNLWTALITVLCASAAVQESRALVVDELGTGSAEVVTVNVDGIGTIPVDAGILKLDVAGLHVDGLCIDPFHFSDGAMSGYQVVGLTSAPKQHLMSSGTALLLDRLWGKYYSPGMSAADAAGLQIAFWQLTGGSGFKLVSNSDYGAAGFLAAVESVNYNGPVADLVALTGPGQDYGVEASSVRTLAVPETSSTLGLLALSVLLLWLIGRPLPRLAPLRA